MLGGLSVQLQEFRYFFDFKIALHKFNLLVLLEEFESWYLFDTFGKLFAFLKIDHTKQSSALVFVGPLLEILADYLQLRGLSVVGVKDENDLLKTQTHCLFELIFCVDYPDALSEVWHIRQIDALILLEFSSDCGAQDRGPPESLVLLIDHFARLSASQWQEAPGNNLGISDFEIPSQFIQIHLFT